MHYLLPYNCEPVFCELLDGWKRFQSVEQQDARTKISQEASNGDKQQKDGLTRNKDIMSR